MKKCLKCGKEFEPHKFAPYQKYCCNKCQRDDYNNTDDHRHKLRLHDRNLKADAIAEYGGFCQICGESHLECLTIDHSFNDGKAHRDEIGGYNKAYRGNTVKMYRWLKKHKYPKDLGLRVLCWNCNCSIGAYGYSPFQEGMGDKFYEV